MNGAARRRPRLHIPQSNKMIPFFVRLSLWVFLTKFPAWAQERGPVQLYIVNDTEESVTAVWLHNLRIENEELIPHTTGPILPGAIESYRVNANDAIELHQTNDDCGTKRGMAYNPQGECPTVFTYVKDNGRGENPTSKFSFWFSIICESHLKIPYFFGFLAQISSYYNPTSWRPRNLFPTHHFYSRR